MGNSGSSGRLHGRRQQNRPPPRQHQAQQKQQNVASKFHQHKVLLDLDAVPRLRPTENGHILQSGGTISQRRADALRRTDLYGSEPDLRFSGGADAHHGQLDAASKLRISRNNRKKYRAPPAPQNEQSDFFEDWDERPSRRLRLFITRAEAKKKTHERGSPEEQPLPPVGGRLRRTRSTPQFQQNHESTKVYDEQYHETKGCRFEKEEEPPQTTNPANHADNGFSNSFLEELRQKQLLRENKVRRSMHSESKTSLARGRDVEECDEESVWLSTTKSPVPVKTFYFGMDEPVDDPFGLESFSPRPDRAASFRSSDSLLSSAGCDLSADETSGGISVRLRATLPRKQVDIPRFSPAAAWRTLSSVETIVPSPPRSTEEDVVESRIQAPPPMPIRIPALLPDKSADSGISGDASPQQYDSAAWTPQQDLEETSSDGGGGGGEGFLTTGYDPSRHLGYTPRFTVSLPKDDKTAAILSYNDILSETVQQQSGLKASFPFARNFPDDLGIPDPPFVDNNWMLSCSIPSSVNFSNNPTQQIGTEEPYRSLQELESPSSLTKRPSFSYLTTGGHIMYLPEYTKPRQAADPKILSRSCENLSNAGDVEEPRQQSTGYKPKKFTFQSTIRQNERKVIAERLSRIAEYTELKRRSEMEVMQKVEEEFQKKREREKADIRQQLRLYNINKSVLESLEASVSNP